jgi:hypothetical protein
MANVTAVKWFTDKWLDGGTMTARFLASVPVISREF